MTTKTKNYLINVGLALVALTLVHWVSQLLWHSEGSPFLRLIIASVYAYFYPLYKPRN
jgi:hypothetical protein